MIFTEKQQICDELLKLKEEDFFLKHILEDDIFFFKKIAQPLDEFVFKRTIANCLKINIRDIVIVGSGKLGFSLKPDKDGNFLLLKFDENGTGTSDLDVGIINSDLFDYNMQKIYYYTNQYKDNNMFLKIKDGITVDDFPEFSKYMLKGWLRPDKMPKFYELSRDKQTLKSHKEVFKKKYDRTLSVGIYKSWSFFEDYQKNNLKSLYMTLLANER